MNLLSLFTPVSELVSGSGGSLAIIYRGVNYDVSDGYKLHMFGSAVMRRQSVSIDWFMLLVVNCAALIVIDFRFVRFCHLIFSCF